MSEHLRRIPAADSRLRDGRVTLATTITSVISAFMASICCVGPLLFALLGIGGAGLLVKLEPYRPYFVALTSVLLGTGFYFTYRKSPLEMSEGEVCETCPTPTANRLGKATLWIATVFVIGFLAFPYLIPLVLAD